MDVKHFHGLAVILIAGGASLVAQNALAQGAEAPANQGSEEVDEVVVSGFRASLQSAADAKRESVNFTDSVFAEDIGKFPDLNIAEALTRIPGIQLTREVNGEGLQINIRGLGTSFTKTVLNGAQVSVASSGGADAQSQNRELDLDLFPTELFNRLDVSKTPRASLIEGGIAGVVNLRSQRAFDNPGTHLSYQLQSNYGEISEELSPRGAMTFSWTNDTFGVLFGVSGVNNKSRTTGFETIGWTNPNLTDAQCGSPAADDDGDPLTGVQNPCNDLPLRGNQYSIPGTVPAGTGGGLIATTPVNTAFLLAQNPGLTIDQIGDALIPRLGRNADFNGTRERYSGLVSVEFRPTDSMRFYADTIYSEAQRTFDRIDMNWDVRNSNFMIPTNMQVDADNVVTSGRFLNSRFFLEARPYDEQVDFWNFNPGAHFDIGEKWQIDVQVNKSRSWFYRESPTILIATPLGTGSYVDFDSTVGDIPAMNTNVNLNDPNAGWTWNGGRLNVSNEKRVTHTEGAHLDIRFGEDTRNIAAGFAYDKFDRGISSRDNSGRWEDVACRNGLDVNGNSPTVNRAPCNGMNANSLITQGALASYLKPSDAGFITVDFDRFMADSNYRALADSAPENNSSATGAATSDISEENLGAYLEGNYEFRIRDLPLRLNAGARYVTTDQVIEGPSTINGVRISTSLPSDYDEILPSFNAAWNVTSSIVVRASASKTLTRVNPSQILPNTNFSDPSARGANQGNPELQPYTSKNIDIGGEWYTGDEGYIGLMLFQKRINAFTTQRITTIPFADLGIPFENLSPTQQTAINNGGGPDNWTVDVTRQINFSGLAEISGYEITWQQPLNMITEGLGFVVNYTHTAYDVSDAPAPADGYGVRVGNAPTTYNATAYYENHGASLRLAYVWGADRPTSGLNQNGSQTTGYFGDSRGQLDLSASYEFENLPTSPQITLNVTNILSETSRQTWRVPSATYTLYDPGYAILLGIRGKF